MSILFPPNPQGQVVDTEDARGLIHQIARSESSYLEGGHTKLSVAYTKLWEANFRVRHKDLQPRLFHLVLCAFDDLTLNELTEALRIDPEGKKPFSTDLQTKHVEWLCHNFLVATSTAKLRWAHYSAKDFLTRKMTEENRLEFSEASNNICMSQIALQLMSQIHHPAWKAAGLDLPYWVEYQSSEPQNSVLNEEIAKIARTVYETSKEAKMEDHTIRKKDTQLGSKNSAQTAFLNHLQSIEGMKTVASVFEAASFASYVAARFLYHLRVVCDTTASISGLERLMRTLIDSLDSALPAVANMVQFVSSVRRSLKLEGVDLESWFAEDFSIYSQLVRRARIASRYESSCQIMKIVWTGDDGNTLIAPLRLLTLINTPNEDWLRYAVKNSRSRLKEKGWGNYPAELIFLACNYSSDKIVALFLNQVFFSESIYADTRKLLRVQDRFGYLSIHDAARLGYFGVIKELVKADGFEARNSIGERHTGVTEMKSHEDRMRKGENRFEKADAPLEVIFVNDDTKLLYVPNRIGLLPIHLVASLSGAEPTCEHKRIFDLMMEYDAKYTSLFPIMSLSPPGDSGLTRRQTSMLLTQWNGQLLIHYGATYGNYPGVKAMLQREFDAFCEFEPMQSSSIGSQTQQQCSQLLSCRSRSNELSIECIFKIHGFSPKFWKTFKTMLKFEAKWMNLTSIRSHKRRSAFLDSRIFDKILFYRERCLFEELWLKWLTDRYELDSNVQAIIDRSTTRINQPTTATNEGILRLIQMGRGNRFWNP